MIHRSALRAFFLLGILLASALSHASLFERFGQSQPSFLPVDRAFPFTTAVDEHELVVRFETHKGYYLYQHRLFLQQETEQFWPSYRSQAGIEKYDEAFGDIVAYYGSLEVRFDLRELNAGDYMLNHQGCADAGLCYPPQREPLTLSDEQHRALNTLATPSAQDRVDTSTRAANDVDRSTGIGSSWFSERSWWAVVGLFFLLGLGLTFTPCVLPMVPILTSVVLGQNNTSPRRGFMLSSVYVLGMALTYAAAGLLVGLLGAGANIQIWLQTPWVLSLFAALFVALSLSMFGLYELQLPARLRERLQRANHDQQGGQYGSVLIMGILSALVVSPCVSAPLAGALVYLSTTGDALLGGSALLALGLGMGAPLIVLGTTGASILPKSGQWMVQVKVFFGVMLLGVAIWLLDRILPGTVTLFLWAILALAYGTQLGALEPAATPMQRLGKATGLVLLIYGAAALLGTLQGQTNPLQPLTVGSPSLATATTSPFFKTDRVDDVRNIIATSQQPVMVDLYADWCISCVIMEREIFAQADVQQALSHVTWVKLDVTANRAEHIDFMRENAVFGPPTILFFDRASELNEARIIGEVDKAAFLANAMRHLPAP